MVHVPYSPPVPRELFGPVAAGLLLCGFIATIYFFIGTVERIPHKRSPETKKQNTEGVGPLSFLNTFLEPDVEATTKRHLWKELLAAIVASSSLGTGLLFLALWAGIYV